MSLDLICQMDGTKGAPQFHETPTNRYRNQLDVKTPISWQGTSLKNRLSFSNVRHGLKNLHELNNIAGSLVSSIYFRVQAIKLFVLLE